MPVPFLSNHNRHQQHRRPVAGSFHQALYSYRSTSSFSSRHQTLETQRHVSLISYGQRGALGASEGTPKPRVPVPDVSGTNMLGMPPRNSHAWQCPHYRVPLHTRAQTPSSVRCCPDALLICGMFPCSYNVAQIRLNVSARESRK